VTTPAPRPGRPPERPSLKEISELIAWARRLSAAGITGVPTAELAAYQAAKHDLLARINALEPENQ
jgi:hypothetical protein